MFVTVNHTSEFSTIQFTTKNINTKINKKINRKPKERKDNYILSNNQ